MTTRKITESGKIWSGRIFQITATVLSVGAIGAMAIAPDMKKAVIFILQFHPTVEKLSARISDFRMQLRLMQKRSIVPVMISILPLSFVILSVLPGAIRATERSPFILQRLL